MAFDIATGSGPSATETTQTASGQGKILGKGSRLSESGSLLVGDKAVYTESGGLNLGKSAKLTKGNDFSGSKGNITVNDSGVSGGDLAEILKTFTSNTPLSAGGAGMAVANNPADPSSGTTQTPSTDATSASQTALDKLKAWWTGLTPEMKLGAGALAVLALWFIFLRKK